MNYENLVYIFVDIITENKTNIRNYTENCFVKLYELVFDFATKYLHFYCSIQKFGNKDVKNISL